MASCSLQSKIILVHCSWSWSTVYKVNAHTKMRHVSYQSCNKRSWELSCSPRVWAISSSVCVSFPSSARCSRGRDREPGGRPWPRPRERGGRRGGGGGRAAPGCSRKQTPSGRSGEWVEFVRGGTGRRLRGLFCLGACSEGYCKKKTYNVVIMQVVASTCQ